jgi:hypothetical protein
MLKEVILRGDGITEIGMAAGEDRSLGYGNITPHEDSFRH